MTSSFPRLSHGFSLLEVTVAMAIMALSLGMLYRAAGSSVRTVSETARYANAVFLAESLLASRDMVEPKGWREAGQWEGFSWTISSEHFAAAPLSSGAVSLQRVQVEVHWNDGVRDQAFNLVTLLPTRRDGS